MRTGLKAMKRILNFLLLPALFIFLAAAGEPKLVIPDVTFDFGTVAEGKQVIASFVLKNQGDTALEIKRVFPACGCTVAEMSSSLIPPGQQASLNVSFDTNGFYGFKVKTIRLFTNDPQRSTVVLTLQGKIERDVEIEPSRLYFGTIGKGSNKVVSAELRSSSGTKILDVISRSKDIELKIEDSASGGKTVSVSFSKDAPIGIFRNRIVVKTSSAQNPVINIPVFARIEGDLKLSPADVSFGLLEGPLGEAQEKIVKVENRSAKAINILSAQSGNASVKAEVVEIKAGFEYQIKISIPASSSGVIRDKIRIETTHPDLDQRVVELPVYGIISR